MAQMSEDEAIYKIMMAEHYLKTIKEQFADLSENYNLHINIGLKEGNDPVPIWGSLKTLLSIIGIQINKPSEPIGNIRELTGKEIQWRYENWTCSNPYHFYQTGTKHCTECGCCGRRKGDGHQCKCFECDIEHSGSNCPNCGR